MQELAYGDRGAGGKIKGGEALTFIIELIKIKGASVPKKVGGTPPLSSLCFFRVGRIALPCL